jgi:cation diffusion facilitator family transporter
VSAPFDNYELPPDKQALLDRGRRLEWWSIGFLATGIVAIGVVMGSSQAMKAMWVEDLVSLIPSIAFLIGAYFRKRPPNDQFPYGYRRAILVAYLAGSVALFGFGLWILGDSVYKLVSAEHPSIGTMSLFGVRFWLGWPMFAALVYTTIPPFVLGRMKYRVAIGLSDKALFTSGQVNKGDWLSGLAGAAGLLGIAFGYWWADSAAAGFIAFEIVKDGYAALKDSVAELMNQRPTKIASKEKDPVVDKVCEAILRLNWVADARVRLRQDGDVLRGEAFVVPREEAGLLEHLQEAADRAREVDWRVHDLSVVPVKSLA